MSVPIIGTRLTMSGQTPRPSLAVPWKAVDVLAALGLVGLVWAVTGVTLGLAGGPAAEGGPATFVLAFLLEAVLLLAAVLFGPVRRRVSLSVLGFRSPTALGRTLLPLGVAAASLAISALYVLAVQRLDLTALEPPPMPPALREGALGIPGFLLAVVWGPLAEEVFFRGFVFPVFLGRWRLVGAALLSSALFALSHGVLGLVIPAFLSGILLALLYAWTGSLWSVWMAHALQNTLTFLVGA